MKIEGTTIVCHPGETFTVEVRESEQTAPVSQQPTTPVESESPQPQQPAAPTDPGRKLYTVGLMGDTHVDTADMKGSMYREDLINALLFFRQEGADFIQSAGDLCEYDDADLRLFNQIYNDYAWAPTAAKLRFFTSLGNHDYLRLFSDGQNLEALSQQFRPFSGEDIYKDMKFFEYDGKWDKQYVGTRTVKSKFSYYWQEPNSGDIWINLSIDYGDHAKPQIWDWCCRAMNLLDPNDKYVYQLQQYVADTPYSREREARFDYQFFHPNALVWLRDICEATRGQRKALVVHLPIAHKAGSEGMRGGQEYYSKLRLWPYTDNEAIQRKYYSGSNTLCGLEMWVLNKLNNEFPEMIIIDAHTHYQWLDDCNNFCVSDYGIVQPSGDEQVPLADDIRSLTDYGWYTRARETPIGTCGMNIHLPSLAKPTRIADGTTLYGASEGALLEVYERGMLLRCIRFRAEGAADYANETVREVWI